MEYTPEEIRGIKKFLASLDVGWWGNANFSTVRLDGLYEAIAEDDGLVGMHLVLMYNPNTPPNVIEFLADKYLGQSSKVYRLINNKSTPMSTLLKILERAPDAVARWASNLAAHDNFPAEKVPEIAQHLVPGYDLEKTLRKPGMSGEIVREIWRKSRKEYGIARAVAGCPVAPPDVLEEIALRDYGRNSADLREILAGNENTPPGILAKLAFDRVLDVRLTALANPSTPEETLRRAYQFSSKHVYRTEIQKALAVNPSCPEDVLIALTMSNVRSVAEAAAEALKKREKAA
jgi:hypothetical protein